MTTPNPGDPENTDEQNLSPNEAEAAAAGAARGQGVNEDDDALVVEPDPAAAVDGDIDPTLAAEIDEATADLEGLDEDAADSSDVEAQLAERTEDLQRLSAEYANYRRRTERERAAVVAGAKASVLAELLPIVDDLDLARQHGDLEQGPMKSLADKFSHVLEGQKLEVVGVEGEEFNPDIHEAVQDASTGDEKVVGTVLRKGYRIGDRLIRTAMVIIAGKPDAGSAE